MSKEFKKDDTTKTIDIKKLINEIIQENNYEALAEILNQAEKKHLEKVADHKFSEIEAKKFSDALKANDLEQALKILNAPTILSDDQKKKLNNIVDKSGNQSKIEHIVETFNHQQEVKQQEAEEQENIEKKIINDIIEQAENPSKGEMADRLADSAKKQDKNQPTELSDAEKKKINDMLEQSGNQSKGEILDKIIESSKHQSLLELVNEIVKQHKETEQQDNGENKKLTDLINRFNNKLESPKTQETNKDKINDLINQTPENTGNIGEKLAQIGKNVTKELKFDEIKQSMTSQKEM